MNQPDSRLSPGAFDRLIGRAIQIDAEGKERIDLDRAREIASELGVSGAAWDAAVLERAETLAGGIRPRNVNVSLSRVAIAALAGGAAGGALGLISAASSGNDILVGGALIAAGLGVGANEYVRRSLRQAHAGIAAWWIAAAIGITLGLQKSTTDIGWYAALSWAGCALALGLYDVLKRRAGDAPTAAPTA